MKFLEKDLEEIIYETYNKDRVQLARRGLNICGVVKRQLRIGNYGVADLVTFEKEYDYEYEYECEEAIKCYSVPYLIITVYELKKDKIGISAYLQAVKYTKGLQEYFNEKGFNQEIKFNIVLIGNDIDSSGSFCFIPSIFNNVDFYKYSYDVDGLVFERQNGYCLTNNGFKL